MHARSFRYGVSALTAILGIAPGAATMAAAREITPQEAVAQVQRGTDEKVLSVQTLSVAKRKVYRIKLLTHDGQIRIVQVPAEQ